MVDLAVALGRRDVRRVRELVRDAGLTIALPMRRPWIAGCAWRRVPYVIRRSDAERVRRALEYGRWRGIAARFHLELSQEGREDWAWFEARRGRRR